MNKQQYTDFQQRLHSHHRLSVNNDCTSHPIYLVQKLVIDWGYMEEYASHHQLYCSCDEIGYDTTDEFFEDWDEEGKHHLLDNTQYCEEDFKEYDDVQGLDILEELLNDHEDYKYNGYTLLHGNERYTTVEIFLTYKAATDFLKAKGWQYGDEGVRIYIDSLCRSAEFKDVLELIIDNKLEFKEEVK